MIVYMLAVHRKESYSGEYGPEIAVAVDEYVMDDSPDHFNQQCAEKLAELGNDITAHTVITVDIDENAVMQALHPDRTPIPGRIVND